MKATIVGTIVGLVLLASASTNAYTFTKAFAKAAPTKKQKNDNCPAAITASLCVILSSFAAAPSFAATVADSPPPSSPSSDILAGSKIFTSNCASCHAGGQNIIMPARKKTLKKEALSQYLSGGMAEGSVIHIVTNGKSAMPAFGGRLSDEDIASVASYVIDQATFDKWETK
ncbi:hypothetical protein TrST_g3420 [Triparma strigata]|uniref:Cytochrome c-553 n=1 Tax=Triparma strigata TaxID=1606541 RepID=A0A9W7EZB9_9STRA|nr:hypothetical protein TrST_g3420 [Triparma strigata]